VVFHSGCTFIYNFDSAKSCIFSAFNAVYTLSNPRSNKGYIIAREYVQVIVYMDVLTLRSLCTPVGVLINDCGGDQG